MSRKLVAYFSASGVTAKAAAELAGALSADIHEIKPKVPYTKEDLDWTNMKSRSSLEMSDSSSRPEIAVSELQTGEYDVLLLGFPIWWYVAPTIINGFLESHDFSGKKIVLFATSGGSGFGKTAEGLKPSLAEDTELVEGKILNGMNAAEIRAWAESLGM